MKNIFKKLLGLDKIDRIEQTLAETERIKQEAEKALAEAKEAERIAKMSPKDLATEKKEPWVAVINTHVNETNVRNGFFELDWNEYFIVQLRAEGYTGQTDEEVVDKWFQELCLGVGNEAGVNMERRGSGFVNRALRDDGLTEVS